MMYGTRNQGLYQRGALRGAAALGAGLTALAPSMSIASPMFYANTADVARRTAQEQTLLHHNIRRQAEQDRLADARFWAELALRHDDKSFDRALREREAMMREYETMLRQEQIQRQMDLQQERNRMMQAELENQRRQQELLMQDRLNQLSDKDIQRRQGLHSTALSLIQSGFEPEAVIRYLGLDLPENRIQPQSAGQPYVLQPPQMPGQAYALQQPQTALQHMPPQMSQPMKLVDLPTPIFGAPHAPRDFNEFRQQATGQRRQGRAVLSGPKGTATYTLPSATEQREAWMQQQMNALRGPEPILLPPPPSVRGYGDIRTLLQAQQAQEKQEEPQRVTVDEAYSAFRNVIPRERMIKDDGLTVYGTMLIDVYERMKNENPNLPPYILAERAREYLGETSLEETLKQKSKNATKEEKMEINKELRRIRAEKSAQPGTPEHNKLFKFGMRIINEQGPYSEEAKDFAALMQGMEYGRDPVAWLDDIENFMQNYERNYPAERKGR